MNRPPSPHPSKLATILENYETKSFDNNKLNTVISKLEEIKEEIKEIKEKLDK